MIKKILSLLLLIVIPTSVAANPPVFTQGFTSNGPTSLNQGANYRGNIYVQPIPDPGAPAVTVNTTGASSHTYYIVGHDGAAACGSGNEGHSGTSAGTTVTNSSNPPTNSIALPGGSTVFAYYDVLKDTTTTSIATCVAQGSVVTDVGQATNAYTNLGASNEGQINGITFINPTFNNPTLTGTGTFSTLSGTSLSSTSVTAGSYARNSGSNSTSGLYNNTNNSTAIAARNAANLLDVAIVSTDTSNNIILGDINNANDLFFQNGIAMLEIASRPGIAGKDVCWADSTAHTIICNPNNTGAKDVVLVASPPSANVIPKATGTNGNLTSSTISDTGTFTVFGEPFSMTEVAAPSGSSGSDICWGDSTAHTLTCSMNNGTALPLLQMTGTPTNNHCAKFTVSGGVTTIGDSGNTCSTPSSAVPSWTFYSVSIPGSATDYIGQGPNTKNQTSELNVQAIIPYIATVQNLYCSWANSPTNNVAITVRKNAADTVVTCNASMANNCHDTTHNFATAAGDLLDLKIVTGVSAATGLITCAFND